MEKPKSYKKELYERWDTFWLADGEEAISLGKSLVSFFEDLPKLDEEDYYLWGQCIYSLNQDKVLEKSHPLFQKSLAVDESYYLARLYSAHCYHDKKDYKSALAEYLTVDQAKLKQEMPIWRLVKLLEQIGFCYAMLGDMVEAEKYFNRVIIYYETESPDELVWVQEAYECLPSDSFITKRLKEAEEKHFTYV